MHRSLLFLIVIFLIWSPSGSAFQQDRTADDKTIEALINALQNGNVKARIKASQELLDLGVKECAYMQNNRLKL
jgi:hypothetical protein